MSWLFSRVLVEAYSGDTSSDGEPSVPLSGNPIPQAYCALDRMTKFSRLSRFGMTYVPLTESRGEELLTLYLAGFPARTSAQQDTAQASPAVDQDSGLKWQGLLGKYDHDTRLWKTAQCSLLADLEQCLEIWPRWGLMQGGVSYQQQTLVRHISESESGLLLNFPTPTVMDSTLSCKGKAGAKGKHSVQLSHLATSGALITENHWETQDKLREMGMLSAAEKRQRFPTVTSTANQLAPSMQSRYANPIFPTPTTGGGGGERSAEREGTGDLNFMARTNKWPTPRASDYKGGGQQMIRKDGKSRMDQLCFNVEYQETGRLNPTWVEWLMGWPLEWTDLKPLETDKSQEWQQQHSDF